MAPGARWSIAVPAAPAVLLGIVSMRGHEKSWLGEVAAAVTFAGMAVPVAMAAGARLDTAVAIAAPFALLFSAGTLAVRTVVLSVRGGGQPRATCRTRRGVFALNGGGAACLAGLVAADLLPAMAFAAVVPGLLTTLAVAAQPPPPTRLRAIGWTFVAASALTGVILVAAVQSPLTSR